MRPARRALEWAGKYKAEIIAYSTLYVLTLVVLFWAALSTGLIYR